MNRNVIALVLAGLLISFTLVVLLIGCTGSIGTVGLMAPQEHAPADGPAASMGLALDQLSRSPAHSSAVAHSMAAIPGALPSEEEELWVIARSASAHDQLAEDAPRSGTLHARRPNADGQVTDVPIPLEHTDVTANITGIVASVSVTQQFHNPYDGKIEAVYTFPLPQNAAVNDFVMTIGDRRIRGIIREKDEAREIYNAARTAGHVASLLVQDRPNIFTQSVANIEPNARVDIDITYFHTLACERDGWFEFVFPMVVGPRFNPAGSADGVGAATRGAPGSTGQPTEVQYLAPGERSGHDIALVATIDAGMRLEQIDSVNHAIDVTDRTHGGATVSLATNDRVPNRDFVLRWKVAGDTIKPAFLTHVGDERGTFSLMLVPPEDLADVERQPIELVFVLDCSGSMSGAPFDQMIQAVRHALRSLRPGDRFQIVRFSNEATTMGSLPLDATTQNVKLALRYLKSLKAGGGTMMVEGVLTALQASEDPDRLRYICFMTDGFIGNETQVLRAMHEHLAGARVFSFCVGSSPNRYLMNRMAKLGNGAVAYLSLNDSGKEVMEAFLERVTRPALTDISVDYGALNATDVHPLGVNGRLPDLFVGRPVIVTGRFEPTDATRTTITVSGRLAGRDVTIPIGVDLTERLAGRAALEPVWARRKIADLVDQAVCDPRLAGELQGSITTLALDHGLMSAFTSYVAVDSTAVTEGSHGTTVAVPVPVPEGVRYETTIPGEGPVN